MAAAGHESLGRRERQIMDIVYRLGRAAAGDVMRELSDPPTYSAVRAMLRYLGRKGHLRHFSSTVSCGLRTVSLQS